MNIKSIAETIRKNGNGEYKVSRWDGKTIRARLFCKDGVPCEYKKGSTRFGHALPSDWLQGVISLERIPSRPSRNTPSYKAFIRNLNKAKVLLTISGLWPEHLNNVKTLLVQKESLLKELFTCSDYTVGDRNEYDRRRKRFEENKESLSLTFSTDQVYHLTMPSGIKAIPYREAVSPAYTKDKVRQGIQTAKESTNPTGLTVRWQGRYDYTVEVAKKEDGSVRAWFSEEYRDAANGYYWTLLNEDYALFCEKD